MRTKLKWRYTMEAIPNQDGQYLCVWLGPDGADFLILSWDSDHMVWRGPETFPPNHVAAWAALPQPEDIVEDGRDER